MPQYSYKCKQGHVQTLFSKISEYVKVIPCDRCPPELNSMAERHITQAPMGFVQGNFEPYACPITGTMIDGRRAHEANLAKHGCRVLEAGETEGVKKRRAAEEAAFDAAVEQTAEEFVEKLPSAKREQLGREIELGADVTVTRSQGDGNV